MGYTNSESALPGYQQPFIRNSSGCFEASYPSYAQFGDFGHEMDSVGNVTGINNNVVTHNNGDTSLYTDPQTVYGVTTPLHKYLNLPSAMRESSLTIAPCPFATTNGDMISDLENGSYQ